MSFKINGRELAKALTGLQKAMARKTNLAALKHIRFHCEDQTVRIGMNGPLGERTHILPCNGRGGVAGGT